MSSSKGRNGPKANFEHSRYKDWRPNYRDNPPEKKRRRRGRSDDDHAEVPRRRRRRSFLGFLLRLVIWVAVLLAIFGPGGDYVNGRAKASDEGCAVRVVVDGDTLIPGCPEGEDVPREIAGYDAPELLRPGCWEEFVAALGAGLEVRKALYGADVIELRGPSSAPVAVPEPVAEAAPEGEAVPEGETPPVAGAEDLDTPLPPLPEAVPGETGEAPEATGEAAEETAANAAPAPVPGVPAGQVRVLVDGTDLAGVMIAAGAGRAPGAAGWCE